MIGNRVSATVELEGLDMAEVGVLAYPEFLPAAIPIPTPVESTMITSSPAPILPEGLAVAKAGAG